MWGVEVLFSGKQQRELASWWPTKQADRKLSKDRRDLAQLYGLMKRKSAKSFPAQSLDTRN